MIGEISDLGLLFSKQGMSLKVGKYQNCVHLSVQQEQSAFLVIFQRIFLSPGSGSES